MTFIQKLHTVLLVNLLGSMGLLTPSLGNPRSLSHEDSTHVVHLFQDAQRSLALLHDKQRQITEISSLAGGCRIKLHWAHGENLHFTELKPISTPNVLHEILNAEHLAGSQGGAVRLTIQQPKMLTLKAAYSTGCVLPDLKWTLQNQQAKKILNFKKSNQNQSLWHPIEIKRPSTKTLTLHDEGFILSLEQGRSKIIKMTQSQKDITWQGDQIQLKLTWLSAHRPLTPLPDKTLEISQPFEALTHLNDQSVSQTQPICLLKPKARPLPIPCTQLSIFLAFLSYQEGIYEGLGFGVGQRGTQALLASYLLSDYLPIEWSKVALGAALDQGLQWPIHYQESLQPLDGRFAAFPFLDRLLTRLGEQAQPFLKSKRGWRMWGSMFTTHLRGLMRLASHFANRPARRYLLRSPMSPTRHELQHDLSVNMTFMPWTLKTAAQLLKNEVYAPLLGARPGEAKRLTLLYKAWQKADHFFEKRIEVYEARRRATLWTSRILKAPTHEPWLELIYDVDVLSQSLPLSPETNLLPQKEPNSIISALSFFDAILGSPTEDRMKHLFLLSKAYPIGLMSPFGMSLENPLFLSNPDLPKQPPPTEHPLWVDVLYQKGLAHQRQRFWPYQISSKLEQYQAEHWQVLSQRLAHQAHLDLKIDRSTEDQSKVEPQDEEVSRHGWHLLSTLALTLQPPQPPAKPRPLAPHELGP